MIQVGRRGSATVFVEKGIEPNEYVIVYLRIPPLRGNKGATVG